MQLNSNEELPFKEKSIIDTYKECPLKKIGIVEVMSVKKKKKKKGTYWNPGVYLVSSLGEEIRREGKGSGTVDKANTD